MPALPAAFQGLHTDEIEREWIYDRGAGVCFIGWNSMTNDEKLRTFNVRQQDFSTAAGIISTSTAVMCNIPFLGKRQCFVLDESPPAISVKCDCDYHGITFSYSKKNGPTIALPNGTEVYLDDSHSVPYLHGYCNSDDTGRSRGGKRTETSAMPGTADFVCPPCGQVPWPGAQASITTTVTPAMAAKSNGDEDNAWSVPPPSPHIW